MYNIGDEITPDQAMRFAIETAKMGRGFVSPNPLVGCVIVDKHHKYLSAGAHLRVGGAHAEINAMQSLSDPQHLVGATVYVTLEPCSHFGKTPPCVDAVLQAQIGKVVYGVSDPNPQVAGQGLDTLRKQGVEVEHFARYEAVCKEMCEQFFYHIQHQRPFVALKVGASLDGKIALQSGESQWITGEEARLHGRRLRAYYDATMIGAGTLQYDDPRLDFRGTGFEGQKQNKIVLLDPKGRAAEVFKDSRVCELHGPKNVFVLTRSEHIAKWSKNLNPVISWEANQQGWQQALKNLYQKGIHSLYVEGGSYAFGQVLTYGLAQKLYLFQSSKVLGKGMSWSKYFENTSMAKVPKLSHWQSIPVGEDRLNTLYWQNSADSSQNSESHE
jgi:diaminohydroxyphosphoribosylaminopyrimidine deaminase/5-amino-6-(5-phosphoribosylamino)uracil reductase